MLRCFVVSKRKPGNPEKKTDVRVEEVNFMVDNACFQEGNRHFRVGVSSVVGSGLLLGENEEFLRCGLSDTISYTEGDIFRGLCSPPSIFVGKVKGVKRETNNGTIRHGTDR